MGSSNRRLWTRNEFILVLDLYFRMPFGQIVKTNPDIIKMAEFINRTPDSVAMRLCNFASCDPVLQARGVKGLINGAKLCQPYWNDFADHKEKLRSAAAQSRAEIINAAGTEIESTECRTFIPEWNNLVYEMHDCKFQSIIKKNYNNKCAVTGLKIPELLVATHIVPASENKDEAVNVSNGLCLSLMHARAFLEGLIGFDDHYKIHISSELKKHQYDSGYYSFFKQYAGKPLDINDVFIKPNTQFLQWHMDTVFNRIVD